MPTPNTKELKKQMALPPIPQAPARDHRDHKGRNRNRVRLEVTPEIATILVEMIQQRLQTLKIDDAAFRPCFEFYDSIKRQLGKAGKSASDPAHK